MRYLRYLSLQFNGRNKEPHRSTLVIEYEGYEITEKDFNIFRAVIRSLLDSTNIRLVSPALHDYVGIENDKYWLACYYPDTLDFDYDLQRLLLKIVFREEEDTLVLALKLLLASKMTEFGKKGENGWTKVFKRKK
jgi:hypothetical protein